MSNWVRVNVAGVTHDGRQAVIRHVCQPGDAAELRREPHNAVDRNAVAVYVRGRHIGYVPAEAAKTIAPGLDSGLLTFIAEIYRVGPFETDDGREIWFLELDIRWRHAKPGDKPASRQPRVRKAEPPAALARKAQPAAPPAIEAVHVESPSEITMLDPAQSAAQAVEEIHAWLDQELRPAAGNPQRAATLLHSDRQREISDAVLRAGHRAADFGLRAAKAVALTADSPLKRIAGDDAAFLWILRFIGFALLAAAIVRLLLSL